MEAKKVVGDLVWLSNKGVWELLVVVYKVLDFDSMKKKGRV